MKKISVIVPCYNAEKWIDRCIRSLVQQTIGLEYLEIILVNDASLDHTYEKLCEWERKYPRDIIVINSSVNLRQGGARNLGLSYASGNYIGFLDADDWIEPDMYEELYGAIKKYSVDVTSVFFQRESVDGEIFQIEETASIVCCKKIEISTKEERREFLKTGLPGSVNTKLYKKELLFSHDITFPEQLFYEDNYFGGLLLFYINSYYVLDRKLYHYMVNHTSTVCRAGTHHLDRLKIEEMKIEEIKKRGFFEDYHEEIEEEFFKVYWCNTLHLLLTKFSPIPYDIIDRMRERVMYYFPDCIENLEKEDYNEVGKTFLTVLKAGKLPYGIIDELAEAYRETLIAQH